MKKTLLMLLLAFSAAAVSEKQADNRSYKIPPATKSDTMAGNLDGSQIFDRRFGDGSNGGTCDYPSNDSGNDNVAYQVFEFHSPSGEMADIEVVLGSLGDSVLFIYCSFDPNSPENDLAAINDDGGAGFASAITPADGVQLDANTVYYAVVAGFDDTEQGTFDLDLGGDLVFGAPAPAEPKMVPTLSQWSLIALITLMLGMTIAFRNRA